MKKRITLLLFYVFCCIAVSAGEISQEQALQKARQVLKGKQFLMPQTARSRDHSKVKNDYYVFNAEKNGGFVIVAGDDNMKDILGYSEKGNLNLAELPDNVKWLLDYYAQTAKVSSGAAAVKSPALSSKPELQPLITTTWDQGDPYNAQCPEINGQKPLTGCVATAMAQVINYFQWPIKSARSVAAYTTEATNIQVPDLPARKFLWSNMNNDEIAWLMRYCGQAVKMNYNTDESGAKAIDIAGALISVFDYSKTTKFVDRSSFSDAEWEELLYNELSVGHPVIYNGNNDQGTSGHSFILHGYRDGLFYINWGWSGQYDGYFALTNLSPNEMQSYKKDHNAIIEIQPSSNNDDEAMETKKERTVHLDEPGTLANIIPMEEWYNSISKLTISGDLNGSDLYVIREMAGATVETLDMSGARIVKGGTPYYKNYNEYYTEDDVVGPYMFYNCRALQTLILPANIKSIGAEAFSESRLRSFVVPKTITSIGSGLFSGCSDLASIEVEEGNPTYYSPAGSNAIIERASQKLIAGCPATVIPEGVTTIASYALATTIYTLTLPESLTTIEENALYGARLRYLFIPKNVKSIGSNSLPYLQAITVDSENTVYDSRNNCNCLIETATNTVLLGSIGSEFPEGIEAIGDMAFQSYNINIINLPQSLKTIGSMAFYYTYLNNLVIPANVISIGEFAFSHTKLKVCKVKCQTPPSISENTFFDVPSDVKLIVPNGTKAAYASAKGWKAFPVILEESECPFTRTVNVATAGSLSSLLSENERDYIEELILTGQLNDDDLKFIREEMCGNDYGSNRGILRVLDMTNASIENNTLGYHAMFWTRTLEEVKLPSTLASIGLSAFDESSIKKIVIPKSVTALGRDIFYQCKNLSSISVEEGNPVFDSRENCNAVIETATNTLRIGCRSTVVPSSVEVLEEYSFSGVNGLTTLNLPDGVKSIGKNAFWADEGLTSVKLSKSVVELGSGPFVGCSNISSFVIDPANPVYDSRNNCNAIIETATNTLIQGFGTTKIPEDVVKLAPQAFQYQSISYLEIPASVKEIGDACFLFCNAMTTVVSHIKKPFPVSSTVFSGDNMRTAVLYVPFGTKKAYSTTAGWGSFPKIVEMEPTDDELGQHAASIAEVDFGKQYAGLNNQVNVPIYVVGGSIDPITSIDYTITTGSKVFDGHLELDDPITYMMTAQVLVPFNADATVGEQEKKLTITKINGQKNESTENSASGTLVTVKRKPKFVPLVEEATGTWCGWCPRGAVGLKLLNKSYGNDVVTVAVHSNDPMELPEYSLNVAGFPSCTINRGVVIDPYFGSSDAPFGIKYDIEAAQREYTIGEISLEAAWKDESQTAINVTTTTTFVEDVASSPYQIGFILLEDKQTGTGSSWAQSNYYSNTANNDPNLKSIVNSPSKIAGMKYDHVPVAVWQHNAGIEGSLPATITSETPMSYSYTLDIAGNDRIQNKAKLTVVAVLVNKETNAVINTAKFSFSPAVEPSVVTVTSCKRTYGDDNPVFKYTVTGGELEGEPEISCEATATSPVGTYSIVIKPGTVQNDDVQYIDGTLTIDKAQLKVTATDCEREQGTENPVFVITYSGWKNGENESVLKEKPVATTEATTDSPVGKYPIKVSGGIAQNYTFEYVAGVLTVTESSGITGISVERPVDIYDTKGYLVRKGATTLDGLSKGVYIIRSNDRTDKKIIINK